MPAHERARIAPAEQPLDADVQERIDRVMRGEPPIALFLTLARDRRLFFRFFAAGLLDPGHLALTEREIVVLRTTANCGSEYEWGVHVAAFSEVAGLSPEQIRSLTVGGAADVCWTERERALIRLCDSLDARALVPDDLWTHLRADFSEEAVMELLMLAGFYRTVSYLTNGLALPLEPHRPTFEHVAHRAGEED